MQYNVKVILTIQLYHQISFWSMKNTQTKQKNFEIGNLTYEKTHFCHENTSWFI